MGLTGGLLAPLPVAKAWRGARRYPHALVLIQELQATDPNHVPVEDAYGQPVDAAAVETPFWGKLTALNSSKVQQANAAGRTSATHELKAPPGLAITKDDQIRWDIDGDLRRYEVNGDPRLAGGRQHNLIIPLQEVTA